MDNVPGQIFRPYISGPGLILNLNHRLISDRRAAVIDSSQVSTSVIDVFPYRAKYFGNAVESNVRG